MKFSNAQAEKLARQIYDRFGARIYLVCADTIVDPTFLAGFISVEAGKTKKGQISETATRFEAHVFAKLKKVRDGVLKSYNRITRADISDATDAALEALAKSYGLLQIMGWHVIRNLKCSLSDLKNKDKHLALGVQLLQIVALPYLKKKDFDSVLRIWNSGKPDGKTHDPDYVYNASKVRKAFAEIVQTEGVPAWQIEPATAVDRDDPRASEEGDPSQYQDDREDNGANQPTEVSTTEKIEEDGKTVEETQTVKNEQDVNQTEDVAEPEPYNKIGFWATIKADLAKVGIGNGFLQGTSEYIEKAQNLPDWFAPLVPVVVKLAFVALILSAIYLVFRVVHYLVDRWQKSQRAKLEAMVNTDVTRKNMQFVSRGIYDNRKSESSVTTPLGIDQN